MGVDDSREGVTDVPAPAPCRFATTGFVPLTRISIMDRSLRRFVSAAAFGCLLLPSAAAFAQAPAAPPQTFWNWMGVPKNPLAGCINRGGNFPTCEKVPPLKAIADPANLASKNPAIKKAAEIKAEEDLAAQKIKAIKYLAEIGCGGCYPGVAEALAAALDDCTEAVRYEAVKAILAASACGQNDCVKKCVRKSKTCKEAMCDSWMGCMKRTCATMHLMCGKPGPDGVTLKSKLPGYGCGAGGSCQPGRCACGDGNCCTSQILNKLSTMAFEKDDRGCWKEPSPRVRAMARQALRACGPNVRPYTEAPVPMPEEVPATPDADTKPEPKEQAPEPKRETAPENREAAPGSSATSVLPPETESADVAVPEAVATLPEAESVDPVVADPVIAEDVVADTTTTEAAAAPVAPAPEDLFPTPTVAAPQTIRPAATKPVRPRMARRGVVIPTAAFFSGDRPASR
jgi:hypothetical protein